MAELHICLLLFNFALSIDSLINRFFSMKKYFLPFLFTLYIIFSAILPSCNKSTNYIRNTSPYLSLCMSDVQSFSSKEWIILGLVLDRMDLTVVNGQLISGVTSASEIRVSENLFLLAKAIIKTTNIYYMPSWASITKPSEPTGYDCVAWALARWGAYSYDSINTWINSNHGDHGVPLGSMNDVVGRFAGCGFCGYNPNSESDPDIVWSSNTTMGLFNCGNGYGHAVNVVHVRENGDFIVADYSVGLDSVQYYNVFRSNMIYIYFNYNQPADSTAIDF